jgi:hypothetical protein
VSQAVLYLEDETSNNYTAMDTLDNLGFIIVCLHLLSISSQTRIFSVKTRNEADHAASIFLKTGCKN